MCWSVIGDCDIPGVYTSSIRSFVIFISGLGVVLNSIDSWSLPSYLLLLWLPTWVYIVDHCCFACLRVCNSEHNRVENRLLVKLKKMNIADTA